MYKLVLIRHGESVWNKENRFTGWTDVGLSEEGVRQAQSAAELLKKEQLTFDCVYTSVLKRAIHTFEIIRDLLALPNIPVYKHWQLNERHYGDLQGLNKAETAQKFGAAQVLLWLSLYQFHRTKARESIQYQ